MSSPRRVVLVVVALAGCPPPPRQVAAPTADPTTNVESEPDRRQRMVTELQDDILSSYERDEPADSDTQLIDPKVGPARIGVGPGDVLYGDDVKLRASSRWPLFVQPGTQTTVRSKRLDIHLSSDHAVSAAWMSDEVSWRITLCGRTVAIPLRVTALYAHDGDRWVQVLEHLSFGAVPEATQELYGLQLKSAVSDRGLADELSRTLTPLLYRQTSRLAGVVWLDPEHLAEEDLLQPAPTMLVAPDAEGWWHGTEDVGHAQIVDGVLNADDRRVGTIGPSVGHSTVAYWAGNFVADLADRPGTKGGKVRLRGTFVFEKRAAKHAPAVDCTDSHSDCKWFVVQGHVSKPMDDINLASIVFGTALLSEKPLQITCDDGRRGPPPTAPAAAAP